MILNTLQGDLIVIQLAGKLRETDASNLPLRKLRTALRPGSWIQPTESSCRLEWPEFVRNIPRKEL
jgi:hypothetical protein